jgi:hypothetical protein
MTLKEAEMLLRSVDQTLELDFSETDSLESLQLAVENKISAYDAHFISLAKTIGVPLVTADKKLISIFPANSDAPVKMELVRPGSSWPPRPRTVISTATERSLPYIPTEYQSLPLFPQRLSN